jgi:hypothetical protein
MIGSRLAFETNSDNKGVEKVEYKYTLIVSQYYHSRHMFICHLKTNFINNAKDLSYDLMTYKRDEGCERELYAGDLDYIKDEVIRRRYNVNDSGDIYFIQSNSINSLMGECSELQDYSRRESRGFQSKKVTDGISEHHNYLIVKEMVEKYFEIA